MNALKFLKKDKDYVDNPITPVEKDVSHDFTKSEVLPKYYFYLHNKQVIKNPIEFARLLWSLPDDVFASHVNNKKNDFANWINDVYGADDFADLLRSTTDRLEMAKKVESYFLKNYDMILRAGESMSQIKKMYENKDVSLIVTDKKGVIKHVNEKFEEITGYGAVEVIGKKPSILKSGKQSKKFYKTLWDSILTGKPFHTIFINKKKDGTLYKQDTIITPIIDSKNNIDCFVCTGREIVDEKAASPENKKEEIVEELVEKKIDLAQDSEGLQNTFREQYDGLYEKVTELRKKGFDTKIAELKLIRIGPKIKIFSVTSAKEDAKKVEEMISEARKEVNELIKNNNPD